LKKKEVDLAKSGVGHLSDASVTLIIHFNSYVEIVCKFCASRFSHGLSSGISLRVSWFRSTFKCSGTYVTMTSLLSYSEVKALSFTYLYKVYLAIAVKRINNKRD